MTEQSAAPMGEHQDRLALTLWAEADGTFYVRGVEIMNGGSRMRLSFQKQNDMANVLAKDAHDPLLELATKALWHRGLLSLPDLRLTLNNLVLAGCRVLITAAEDGAEQIMIRFRHCFGNLLGLFRKNVLALNMAVEEIADGSARALDELYLEVANFGHHIDSMLDGSRDSCPIQTHQKLAALSQRIRETVFVLSQRELIRSTRSDPREALPAGTIHSLKALPRH
ncbi:MAG: hypothetical protein AAFR79_03285 [Pseudomonadota bacterium]